MNFVFGLESHPQDTSLGIGKCPIIPKNLKSETLQDLCILGEGESPAVRRVKDLCCPRCLSGLSFVVIAQLFTLRVQWPRLQVQSWLSTRQKAVMVVLALKREWL